MNGTQFAFPPGLLVVEAYDAVGDYLDRIGREDDRYDPDDPSADRARALALVEKLGQARETDLADPVVTDPDDRAMVIENLTTQPRERPVQCRRCFRATWNVNAVCFRCVTP